MFESEDGYDAYRFAATEAKAASADPYQLVLMLMDGLLDEIARAEGHILAKQFERKGLAINKCLQILGGLDSALDMNKGVNWRSICIVFMTTAVKNCSKSAFPTMLRGSPKCAKSCKS